MHQGARLQLRRRSATPTNIYQHRQKNARRLPLHENKDEKSGKKRKARMVRAIIQCLFMLIVAALLQPPLAAVMKNASHRYPRWVQLDGGDSSDVDEVFIQTPGKEMKVIQMEAEDSDSSSDDDESAESPDQDESSDSNDKDNEASYQERSAECVFPKPPTIHNLGSCNPLHEIDMMPQAEGHFAFVHAGGKRDVYKLADPIDQSDFALKTSRFFLDFVPDRYKAATLDSMIMEGLSSSPYVASIYASCGTTLVMEYAPAGNLHELIHMARKTHSDKMSSIDKLRICYQISTGLADLHDVLNAAHADICSHQYIWIDGVYKLNDFNQGMYMPRNVTSDEFCPVNPIYNDEQLKEYPPELVLRRGQRDLSKIDTYMMTNTMFLLLAKKWVYEGLTQRQTKRLMRKGQSTEIPIEYRDSKDPAIVAIVKAIDAGWNHDPKKRATARQISDLLAKALQEIEGTDNLGIVRVSIPPLPDDYEHDSKDYWNDLMLGASESGSSSSSSSSR